MRPTIQLSLEHTPLAPRRSKEKNSASIPLSTVGCRPSEHSPNQGYASTALAYDVLKNLAEGYLLQASGEGACCRARIERVEVPPVTHPQTALAYSPSRHTI
jgi:hypothetical protein